MAPISPGRLAGPPRKAKKPTATTKTHRFESFSKRIARLKIDPVHRVEKYKPVEEDLQLSQSHFRIAFDHWSDLNQSETYRSFSRQVLPLCESLPQLLHHANTVCELLVQHIEKKDENALEPLLSLVAAFAHDLGEKFEAYFSRLVTLVLQVASGHDGPDVVEWCFKAVAWIFRFLSRLLVPDLRSLLSIMMPYLGSAKQKSYVTRFAAESLAFLLRKCAMKYATKSQYLQTAVSYLLQDLQQRSVDDQDVELYQVGIMTLFSEAALGVDGGLHSSAPSLLAAILDYIFSTEPNGSSGLQVLDGVLINMIHQTDVYGFQPILEFLGNATKRLSAKSAEVEIWVFGRMLHLVVGTRKGSRIREWKSTIELSLHIAEIGTINLQKDPEKLQQHLVTIALIMQYAPMDELPPFVQRLLESVKNLTNPKQFLAFCDIFASLGSERFQSLLLSHFQTYILSQWQDDEGGLCLLLKSLHNQGFTTAGGRDDEVKRIPLSWERRILERCQACFEIDTDEFDPRIDGFMQLTEVFKFPGEPQIAHELQVILRMALQYGFKNPTIGENLKTRFALGRGFQTYLRIAHTSAEVDPQLWDSICRLPANCFGLVAFLRSLREYARLTLQIRSLTQQEERVLQSHLTGNLLTDANDLKLESVWLLKDVSSQGGQWLDRAAKTMSDLIATPYTLKREREITALIRELPRIQKQCLSQDSLRRVIPAFCMGLLPRYHATPLQELCCALGEMCAESDEENFIVGTATEWLQSRADPRIPLESAVNGMPDLQYPTFQCSNIHTVAAISKVKFDNYMESHGQLVASFLQDHKVDLIKIPSSSRRIALQLFTNVPRIAEKRSRFLVPIFLAASAAQKQISSPSGPTASISSHTLSPDVNDEAWTFADRKLFLELFGKFSNPNVLHRSHEVRTALLELLTNGNSEVQQLALKALFTWKDSSIRPYEETLLRLLDGKADSGELDLLLHSDPGYSSIEDGHRAALMPILLRVLFGLMINQSRSKGPQESKRKTTLRKLFNLSETERLQFLNISLGPLAAVSPVQQDNLIYSVVPIEQQYGFLRTMQSMLSVLKTQMSPFGETVLPPVLYCLSRASHVINETVAQDDSLKTQPASTLVRNVRRIGLECLTMIFEFCEHIEWAAYLPIIFAETISPRLHTFAIDTAQGISGLLRLASVWSRSAKMVGLLQDYDPRLLPSIFGCISISSAKDEVKIFVLNEIVMNIAILATDSTFVEKKAAEIIQANIEPLLANAAITLRDGPTQGVLDAIVSILPPLVPFATSSRQAQPLLASLAAVLGKNHKLNPRVKAGLLKAIQNLLDSHYTQMDSTVLDQIYNLNSSLFDYFRDVPNRRTLSKILETFAKYDTKLVLVSRACHNLNMDQTLSTPRDEDPVADMESNDELRPQKKSRAPRLDEVDYDQQLRGFESINALKMDQTTAKEWLPVLYNLLYYSRAVDDFTIRSNAVSCLKQFIEKACQNGAPCFTGLIRDVLLPAFEKGVKESSESIRANFVLLFGLVVQNLGNAPELEDMKVLLVGNDEEASFFANILHIQQHRRLRAIRRLVSEADKGTLQGRNISKYFLPLLERFVFDTSEDENTQTLKGQSIVAIGSLLKQVEWSQFRAAFRRYRGLLDSNTLREKDVIKLLSGAADALSSSTQERMSLVPNTAANQSLLGSSLPATSTISTELKTHFISKLTEFIKHKDEAQASLRLPAAIVAIKLFQLLPDEDASHLIPAVLLDVCNILRSRSQEIRDGARDTLADIALLLGPSYVHVVVKELRTALTRGYQMHVLTYTMHKVIVTIAPLIQPGDLDYCLAELIAVVMDDVFGLVGLEKDSDDYVSSMKEVKGNKKNSKSFGIIETLARLASVRQIPKLMEPLRVLLMGKLGSKQLHHADELLRRIGIGLAQNPAASTREMLVLSYELIQDLYKHKTSVLVRQPTNDEVIRQRYLVQLESTGKTSQSTTSPLLYKIHRFSLDLLRSTLHRHQDLLTAQNLQGFLPFIGDALIGQQEDVKISALRVLSVIIKLPIPDLNQNATIYIREAVQIVHSSSSTNNEAPQAALKLIASILRERPGVDVRKGDLAYLLHKVTPDLEEPDRQGSSFNLIKAVMTREIKAQKFELAELYELADKISIMMVTNHTHTARDIARGVFVHFLLEYPQTKKRWEKQIRFLAENLEYQYPEGRRSAMEAINILVSKSNAEKVQEIVSWFFFPVVLRLANDDDSACRDVAGALLAQLFTKANVAETEKMLQSMREWISQTQEATLMIVGMKAYEQFLETPSVHNEAAHTRSCIEQVLLRNRAAQGSTELGVVRQALDLLSTLVATLPAAVMTRKQSGLWSCVRSLLSSEDIRVQSASLNLICSLFKDIAEANSSPEPKFDKLPLTGTHGMQLDETTMIELLRSCLRILRRLDGTSSTLGISTVQSLLFMGRCFELNGVDIDIARHSRNDSKAPNGMINSEIDSESEDNSLRPQRIPATQYLLHQLSAILRREPRSLTASALRSKSTSLQLLTALLPHLSSDTLHDQYTVTTLFLPLCHLTDSSLVAPRSADPDFEAIHQSLVASAHEVMEVMQRKMGDSEYVQVLTQVSREVRDRRENRRKKRRIEGVLDPEKRAVDKKRRNDRKSERKKEVGQMHRVRRNLV